MSEKLTRKSSRTKADRSTPAVSAVLAEGHLVELVFDRQANRTRFAVWRDDDWTLTDRVEDAGRVLVPYSPDNNLMQHSVVLLRQCRKPNTLATMPRSNASASPEKTIELLRKGSQRNAGSEVPSVAL